VISRPVAVMTLVAGSASAYADGMISATRAPRAIGRAGVATVGDDGGGALLGNPAAMARRDAVRGQVALAFADDELSWQAAASTPAVRDQSSSRLAPLVAVQGAVGDFILGAGLMTSGRGERVLRRPGMIPPAQLGQAFEYRYSGLAGAWRRDTAVVGVARRIGESVALGVSLGGSRVSVAESRRVWAGDVARVVLGVPAPDTLGDPRLDVEVDASALDPFVPSATIGALVAPADSRVELAASVGWSARIAARGDASAFVHPDSPLGLPARDGRADVTIAQPLVVRTGARWLGERWIGELGGELWWFPRDAETTAWALTGLTIRDATIPTVPREAALSAMPSRISARTHGALRGAVDLELVPGFLWATAGYAYATASTARARQSPTFGDLGGHTAALGLEASAGGFTITLGWARTWSVALADGGARWQLDNPFGTGDGSVRAGRFDGSADLIGLSIDAVLDPGD
jgi:hypothetical protein